MVSLHRLSVMNNHINNTIPLISGHAFKTKMKNQSYLFSSSCTVHAVEEKDSEQYEMDPDKAKEALQKLDQQLQALSRKQVKPPKIKASDVKLTRDATTEEVPEISGSVLAYATSVLVLFTIFYNILFYAVIKPSIDGPEPLPSPASTPYSQDQESSRLSTSQLQQSIPEFFTRRQ